MVNINAANKTPLFATCKQIQIIKNVMIYLKTYRVFVVGQLVEKLLPDKNGAAFLIISC